MALVTLTSDLSRIRRKFGSNTKTAGNTDISKRVGVKKDLNTAILPRTNMLDSNGNVQINYDEKNKFQVPLDRNNSKLKIHWDDAQDSYYAKGPTNDILGLKKESRLGSPNQPYVIREIGQRWDGSDVATYSNTVDFFRGGASTIAGRVAGDLVRTGKFLLDYPGFTVKQFGLQLLNVGGDLGERANIYNPISPLLNTVPIVHTKRHIDIPIASDILRDGVSTLINKVPLLKGLTFSKANDAVHTGDPFSKFAFDIKRKQVKAIGEQGRGGGPREANIFKKLRLGYSVDTRLADDITSGDRLNLVPYGSKTLDQITESDNNDFVPFRFKDVNNNKYIVFRALLSGITDSFSPEYASERYVGRPDNVYVYQGTNREIAFSFDIYPKTRQELPVLWEKLNYLVGLVYPSWAKSGGGMGMIAPFIELTIGDMYKDTPGFLSQLSLTVQDGTTWEIVDWKLPKYIQANCSFTYIGKYLPNQIGKHYELDWLKDTLGDGTGTFKTVGDKYPDRAKAPLPRVVWKHKLAALNKVFDSLGQPREG